jgi:peptide chain release factor 1
MLDKLKSIEKKYLDLREQMMDSSITSDMQKSIQISKELSSLQVIYDLIQEYKKYYQQLNESKDIIKNESDSEIIEMAKEEIKEAELKLQDIDQKIKIALLPTDPNDEKNIYLEIRPAA